MTILQALGIIKPKFNTRDAVKEAWRERIKEVHPDLHPELDRQLAQTINVAYEMLMSNFGKWSCNQKSTEFSVSEELLKVYHKIAHYKGLEFEICGVWLWVTGDTWQYKTELKKHGLKFAKKKASWFWAPPETKKRKRRTSWTMQKIRSRYGSMGLDPVTLDALPC